MGKPHPFELRQRVVDHVAEGHTHRSTAAHFRVSAKFVNDIVKLHKETGSLDPKPQGREPGHGKLGPYKDWLLAQIDQQGDVTLDQLARRLKEEHDVDVHRWSVCRLLHKVNLSHKKRPFMPKNSSARM